MRASKKSKKSQDTTLTPDEWKDAVNASAAQDGDEAVLDGTGVTHDGAGPVHATKLTAEERQKVGDDLAHTLREIDKVKAAKKKAAKDFKGDLEDLEADRDRLLAEWETGVRSGPPPVVTEQETLPGVDA